MVSFPCPQCVCVCVCYSCCPHPTSSLPCFPYHSLFLWADICGKINQSQTSHLSSQINFAPLFNLQRSINFKRTYTHPGVFHSCQWKVLLLFSFSISPKKKTLPISCLEKNICVRMSTCREESFWHIPLVPHWDRGILNEERTEAVIGK